MDGTSLCLPTADSLYFFGLLKLYGISVSPDPTKARECIRKAAELRHLDAMFALGVILFHGKGAISGTIMFKRHYKLIWPKCTIGLVVPSERAFVVERHTIEWFVVRHNLERPPSDITTTVTSRKTENWAPKKEGTFLALLTRAYFLRLQSSSV